MMSLSVPLSRTRPGRQREIDARPAAQTPRPAVSRAPEEGTAEVSRLLLVLSAPRR